MAPKEDGYESGYESDLENQEGVKKAATNLMRRSSELSAQGQSVVGDFAGKVLNSVGISQAQSETSNDFQQYSNNGSRRLSSGSISESEVSDAVNRAAAVISNPKVQGQLNDQIKNNPSFFEEKLTKFNNLSNKDKSLFGLGAFGIAVGAPLAIVALPVLATVAAIAGLAVAIIGGLKLATPSKAEFKQAGKEIMHSAKSAANILPGETNLEKLWKSTHKPGVTAENPNLEEFLTKYCFPEKQSNGKTEIKFDSDKIEALKHAAQKVGLDLDIDRMVRKGESKVSGDYVQGKSSQAQDNKFIATASEIATAVMEKDHLIDDKFKDKLSEIKQPEELKKAIKEVDKEAKKVDKAVGESSLVKLLSSKKQSHTENIKAGREESSNSLNRS